MTRVFFVISFGGRDRIILVGHPKYGNFHQCVDCKSMEVMRAFCPMYIMGKRDRVAPIFL
jgi:hypothetical protein